MNLSSSTDHRSLITRHFFIFLFSTLSAHATRDLLVANPATNCILRFDGQTGASKGNFVAPGAGGLISPRQMQQGPDGALYVADFNGHVVRKYSPNDGTSILNFQSNANVWCAHSIEFRQDNKLIVCGRGTNLCNTRSVEIYEPITGQFLQNLFVPNTNQLGNSRDFLFMPNGDFLFVSSLNTGSRYTSGGAFISHFLNPTGNTSILNNPGGILFGPDGNLWVSSKGLNRVTRSDPTTGAKIDDIISGGLLDNGPN